MDTKVIGPHTTSVILCISMDADQIAHVQICDEPQIPSSHIF